MTLLGSAAARAFTSQMSSGELGIIAGLSKGRERYRKNYRIKVDTRIKRAVVTDTETRESVIVMAVIYRRFYRRETLGEARAHFRIGGVG